MESENLMRADLHIHSTYSDGSLSPSEIVPLAREKGLSVLGITDHDTADHFPESIDAGEKNGVTVIPGVEFSVLFEDTMELHIVGYALDSHNEELRTHLRKVRNRRLERAREILERLDARNVRIPDHELEQIPANQTIGRMTVARLLFHYGYVRSIDEAFDRYIGANGSAFVLYKPAEAFEVIELIDRCGGISVFAHPSYQELEQTADALCEAGLDGIELWRPAVTRKLASAIRKKASQHDLVLTGGSDWHFEGGRTDLGEFYVEDSQIGEFLDLVDEKQLQEKK